MPYAKLLSDAALYKFDKEFGVTYVPPKPEPRVVVTMRLPDDYPHMCLCPSWKKRLALMEAQNYRCAYCGDPVLEKVTHPHIDNHATVDHVLARSAGGRSVWSNEVIACHLCNSGRGSMDAMIYYRKVQAVGRFEAARWGAMMQAALY